MLVLAPIQHESSSTAGVIKDTESQGTADVKVIDVERAYHVNWAILAFLSIIFMAINLFSFSMDKTKAPDWLTPVADLVDNIALASGAIAGYNLTLVYLVLICFALKTPTVKKIRIAAWILRILLGCSGMLSILNLGVVVGARWSAQK